ncbi:MAG: hypothetical protein OXL96_21155 [Candidatus Poribacteria bacterium]|nr:hypothetical protein [Candidatus Poribacteria bacterium]
MNYQKNLEERVRSYSDVELVDFFRHLWERRHWIYPLQGDAHKTCQGRLYIRDQHRQFLRAYINEMRVRRS